MNHTIFVKHEELTNLSSSWEPCWEQRNEASCTPDGIRKVGNFTVRSMYHTFDFGCVRYEVRYTECAELGFMVKKVLIQV